MVRGSTWLVLSVIIGLSAIAQLAHAKVRPGVEVGANLTSLRYDDELSVWEPGWRLSFSGGATLLVPINDRLGIQTGLRYVQQGNRVEYDGSSPPIVQVGEFRIVQSYVSVPVLLALRPLPSERVSFEIGPEVAFLISGRLIVEETVSSGGPTMERTEYADIKDRLDPVNLSARVGAGIDFPLENHTVVLGLTYSLGLVGVANEDDWFSDWKTQGIEALLGFRW